MPHGINIIFSLQLYLFLVLFARIEEPLVTCLLVQISKCVNINVYSHTLKTGGTKFSDCR